MIKKIDLGKLYSNIVKEILIDENFSYDESYLKNTEMKKLQDIKVKGKLKMDEIDDLMIDIHVNGEMILLDSISLEEVEYPFSFHITNNLDEKKEKNENILDIYELIWENIVLEIPLKFTKVNDLSKFHGDGWQLIDEDHQK